MASEEEAALSLQRAQLAVDESIVALGGYWAPLANLARLFEECGELARAVNQVYGPKVIKTTEAPATVAAELGDVLYVLLVLANSLHLDAETALCGALGRAHDRAVDKRTSTGGAAE
jgi:NTP pyrophosphatase (non-canonical NTP hydrolase)